MVTHKQPPLPHRIRFYTFDLILYVDDRHIDPGTVHNATYPRGAAVSLCWSAVKVHQPQLLCEAGVNQRTAGVACIHIAHTDDAAICTKTSRIIYTVVGKLVYAAGAVSSLGQLGSVNYSWSCLHRHCTN